MIYLALLPLALALAVLLILNAAYPASILWGWFISPLGLPDITFWQAAGIMVTISVFRQRIKPSKKEDEDLDKMLGVVLAGFAAPWIALAFGWLFV